jgi:hypothetical protein
VRCAPHDGRSHGETLERVDYYEVEIAETRRGSGVPGASG